jgi:Cu/Zn superoxide dismutase
MSSNAVPLRLRRFSIASIVLVIALLAAPLMGVSAQWAPWLQAPIQAISGTVMGTATFTPASAGGVTIHIQVRGFDPVAGSHHLAIRNVGQCSAPYFYCAGAEILVLPDIQFNPDGSANYTTTAAITMDWLRQPYGTAIYIHADTSAVSPVIGCGVIWGSGAPAPGWQPPYQQPPQHPAPWHPRPTPTPTPPTVVGRLMVTAGLGLRLRSGPGTNYGVRRIVPVRTILQNTGVEQWASGMLWVKVIYNGQTYWAARQYVMNY